MLLLAGRYEILGEIGRGGCAVIYEANDRRLGRVVALKLVKAGARDERASARLEREARAGASIHHPNVCGVSDAGYLEDGRPYLVMERLHGMTLTQHLHQRGVLAPMDAIDIGLQILSALDAAHASGIVHRDVKPDNVFLVPRTGCAPLVKLLDFGMCRNRASRVLRDDMTLTRAGQVVGTPEYMSPEQVSGSRAFDARIDLYAVGVMLYEALSGHRAFPGKDAREVVTSVLNRALPPLRQIRPSVPPALERIVMCAMDRDPWFRYATAGDFQRALHEAKTTLELRPPSMPPPPPPPARSSRTRRSAAHDAVPPSRRPPAREDIWDAPTRVISPSSRRAGGMR